VSKKGMDHELNGGDGECEIDSEYDYDANDDSDDLDQHELRAIFSQDVADDDYSDHDWDSEEPESESKECDEESAHKRPRQEQPEDKEEIVWDDRPFRRGVCYICEANRSHYTILHFLRVISSVRRRRGVRLSGPCPCRTSELTLTTRP
jgi:hypothetical protein